MDDTYLYPYSAREAADRNELALWRSSHQANIACKEAIEASIRRNFDGKHLSDDCAASVVAEYGYKRTAFVLANTLQEMAHEDGPSRVNQNWAKSIFVPPDAEHNREFAVESPPAVLGDFVDMYRRAYQALGLFGPAQCEPNSWSELDYEGKVLVLSPATLKESCWKPEDQLWLAHDGFGCSPHAIGRSIRCTCLGDGEMTRWNRADFVGILKEEYLPDWAMEKLTELQGQKQSDGPSVTGMTMK